MPKPMSDLPDTEVISEPAQEKRQYRKFSAEDKLRIVKAAESCTAPGQLGELLRKERIYSSQLTKWQKQLSETGRSGLQNKPVGRKPKLDSHEKAIQQLQHENRQLTERLERAEGLLELQKKAFSLLERINNGINS